MADDRESGQGTQRTGSLPLSPDARAEDAWAGEDDAWLEVPEGEEESPLGLFGVVLVSAALGALIWALVGLALYRLIAG